MENYSEGILNFIDALYEVMRLSPLLPMTGLLLFRHDTENRFVRNSILVLTGLDLFTEFFSEWAVHSAKILEQGMPVLHVYGMVIGVVLIFIFTKLLKGFVPSWSIWIINVITFSLGIYAWIAIGPYALYSWPYSIVQASVILLSFLYFLKVFFGSKIKDLTRYLPFWLVSAIFFYNGTMMFVTLFEGLIRSEMSDLWLYSYSIILITSILYNLIFLIGIIRTGKWRFSAQRKQSLAD